VNMSGSLSSKVIGLHLRLTSASATPKTLAALLNKLAAAVSERRRSRVLRRPSSATAGTETDNLRIADVRPLLPPACLLEELPRDAAQASAVASARQDIAQILSGESDRIVVLAGPAVVDNASAALEYGARLAALSREVKDDVLLVMTAEIFAPVTPSTSTWPGLLFDPKKDGTYAINQGIRESRNLLLQLARLGLPTALEFRETITPQFFADLLSYASVNASSETLAELVSGLSMPAGLYASKRGGAEDDVARAVEARAAAGEARHFLGVTAHGLAGIVESTGNYDCAIVLGGGGGTPGERARHVLEACRAEGGSHAVVASCGGGGAIDAEQIAMVKGLLPAIAASQPAPRGVALHSYLLSGAQIAGRRAGEESHSIRGLSITEPCMDWMATEKIVRDLAAAVRERRAARGITGSEAPSAKKARK